jgi:transposase
MADRAYDSDALRQTMNAQGAWANLKPMPARVKVPAFSPFLYRYRNLVERFFNKLEHFRAVRTNGGAEFSDAPNGPQDAREPVDLRRGSPSSFGTRFARTLASVGEGHRPRRP